ncbi:DUF1365 domain-containing protein [Pacificoceanicola onchidii]|uniref:DUF1365 domain-containing protein n=1 Tax=Pacificoceanicola onchidii TaxID=2562685 RepID=UPI0010A5009F|nr:DUF1365 domain-containing protein [Pacificoceanicola onchidii]
MTHPVDHIAGYTYHGRKGAIQNGFRYSIDYVLFNAETEGETLFRFWPFSVLRRDHGGPPKAGTGAAWARAVLDAQGVEADTLELLTQPRVLGYVFNPVSFWLAQREGSLIAVIAEVTNTFGDRHSYLCVKPDGSEITAADRIEARKILHVSPFQPIAGAYTFRFDIRADQIGIWIDYHRTEGGLIATLVGKRKPLRRGDALRAIIRRPFGARRVMALIHWQALKLKLKGALYRNRPAPPADAISASGKEVQG